MGLGEASGGQRFPRPVGEVWSSLRRVAPRIGKVKDEDDMLMRLTLTTGASLLTWGETIVVRVDPIDDASCMVEISTAAKGGGVIGVAGNMAAASRGSKHANELISAISADLRRRNG